jgi:hypothetical protein
MLLGVMPAQVIVTPTVGHDTAMFKLRCLDRV